MKNVVDFLGDLVMLANATDTMATANVAVAPEGPAVLVIAVPGDTKEKILGEYFAEHVARATA